MTVAQPAGITVPNVTPLSEWRVRLNGAIATCVEAASTVLLGVYHLAPVNAQTDKALADQLIALGEAGKSGATNWSAASKQLAGLGLPNQAYGPAWFQANDFEPVVNAALNAHIPVLFGLSNANALRDTYTGEQFDRGVYGHAITLVGKDATGYIVADPNTPNTPNGGFEHYTALNLRQAGASSMVIPDAPPTGATGLNGASSTFAGLLPVAQALDAAQQFPGFDVLNPVGSVLNDFKAFWTRFLIALVGLVIFLAALWWLVRPAVNQAERAAPAIAALVE